MSRVHLTALPLAATAILSLIACEPETFHEGIGRPPSAVGPRPQRLSVEIVEVAHQQFIELLNTGGGSIDLSALHLESPNLGDALVEVNSALDAGARLAVDTATLDVTPAGDATSEAHGELALVDEQGFVHAYISWGPVCRDDLDALVTCAHRHPAASGSSLYVAAFETGAAAGDDFVSVPAGTNTETLALVREGAVRGCTTATRGAPIDTLVPLQCQ